MRDRGRKREGREEQLQRKRRRQRERILREDKHGRQHHGNTTRERTR